MMGKEVGFQFMGTVIGSWSCVMIETGNGMITYAVVVYKFESRRVELERSPELERKWAEMGQPADPCHLFFFFLCVLFFFYLSPVEVEQFSGERFTLQPSVVKTKRILAI
jgi:hypothetical protein